MGYIESRGRVFQHESSHSARPKAFNRREREGFREHAEKINVILSELLNLFSRDSAFDSAQGRLRAAVPTCSEQPRGFCRIRISDPRRLRGSTGLCLKVESLGKFLELHRHRQAVADGKNRGEQFRSGVQQAIEFDDCFGGGLGGIFLCDFAAPQNIVGHE